jgi:hypothetical protein
VDVAQALEHLLGANRSGDERTDLIRALHEAMRRREQNSRDGGAVIAALVQSGLSYRQIEELTGIPRSTLQRWATPPGKAE